MIEGDGADVIAAEDEADARPRAPNGSPAASGSPTASRRALHSTVGRDAFVGMSTSEAIRAFLGVMGKGNPQGPREMARALVHGGRGDVDEETAYANVTSALKRLKKNGEVTQVRRGEWGLSAWYALKPKSEGE